METRRRARLWMAAWRAHLGQPKPERIKPVDGALLRRHGDAGRHDTIRGPGHEPATGTLRRAGHRPACAAHQNAKTRAEMAARLPAERVLVRTDVSQTRWQAVRRNSDPRRRSKLRTWLFSSVAIDRADVEVLACLAAGLRCLAHLRIRIRTRPACN